MEIFKLSSSRLRTVFDIEKKREKIKELEGEVQSPDFWQNKEKAIKVNQELTVLKAEVDEFRKLEIEFELLKGKPDEEKFKDLGKKIRQKELKTFLFGKYDRGNAVLSIFAGAGGQDAQDWATMLLRMYERYCQRKGFEFKILHQSFGEAGGPEGRIGTKQAFLEIKGKYAFGSLKQETGVHRLVRVSPFSPQKLRHTSFALVEILPEIRIEESDIKINPEDLKIDFYRASGPGGQYVNKRESSVRITHLPSGIVVSCQSERLQGDNRKKATEMLLSKLHQLKEKEKKKEISKLKGKKISIEWGNQIRNYVLHPYKMVKDLRTKVETSDVEGVLDGNLDKFLTGFIETEIK